MAIICPGCGEAQPDNARFCNACGCKMPEQTPPPEPEQVTAVPQEQSPAAEPEQIAAVPQEQLPAAEPEQDTPPAEAAPGKRKSRKPLIIILAICVAVVIAALACLAPMISNARYDDIYQRLWGNLLMYEAGSGKDTQLTILLFEDDMTCQVHTYYFFDNRHLTQDLPYTVTDVQEQAADVYIGGLHYTAVPEGEYGITLTDDNSNTYHSYSAYTVEDLIANLRISLQTRYVEELFSQYQEELSANKNTAEVAFGNISKWIDYDMKDMLYYIFDPYPTITCEPEEGSTTRFVFTVTGKYYPNRAQLPQIMHNGTMVATYDIETQELTITEGSEILNAMDVYYLFGLGGAEKEALRNLYGY